VVNARISDRSFPRYRRLRRWLGPFLGLVDVFVAQSRSDRERLEAIGAASARIIVGGNLKFDVQRPAQTPIAEQLRQAVPPSAPVIVCGSTVEGEEELLITAFKQLVKMHQVAVMILAPRHPERFDTVAQMLASNGVTFVRRSAYSGGTVAGSVFLLDSIGELSGLYYLATLAFVGGSLVPRGGHNILEPAQFGRPILVGPHTENFRDIIAIFSAEKAVMVIDRAQLISSWHMLLDNQEDRLALGHRAQAVFEAHAGAVQRTLDALEVLLWKPSTLQAQR
jgi:3-deoxy-D-manno-octulosonic-acid transferase